MSKNRVLFFIVFTYLSVSVTNTNRVEKKIVKRADIDLQTCINNFDVHKDKIIRTQDSRDMGAKYLNEIDLGSREECLRLCCETENCDVFVFEEKVSWHTIVCRFSFHSYRRLRTVYIHQCVSKSWIILLFEFFYNKYLSNSYLLAWNRLYAYYCIRGLFTKSKLNYHQTSAVNCFSWIFIQKKSKRLNDFFISLF